MRILVLAGGDSAEREVSLDSGTNVARALTERGHSVELFDPSETPLNALRAVEWDIAIPMVHGTGGEDGQLQQDLERFGLKWVGSSAAASELTFDKVRTNQRLREAGIPVPDSVVVQREESVDSALRQIESLGSSVVTKPPRQGSSIGVTIATNREQIEAGLRLAFRYDDRCLVERYVEGKEATVALLDGQPLPSIYIKPVGWYHYESKYADDRTEYHFPSKPESERLGQLAKQACDVCGVTGIARVDLRVDHDQNPFILEINTIPGMTSHSLVPMAAAKARLSLAELFGKAINTALTIT